MPVLWQSTSEAYLSFEQSKDSYVMSLHKQTHDIRLLQHTIAYVR